MRGGTGHRGIDVPHGEVLLFTVFQRERTHTLIIGAGVLWVVPTGSACERRSVGDGDFRDDRRIPAE